MALKTHSKNHRKDMLTKKWAHVHRVKNSLGKQPPTHRALTRTRDPPPISSNIREKLWQMNTSSCARSWFHELSSISFPQQAASDQLKSEEKHSRTQSSEAFLFPDVADCADFPYLQKYCNLGDLMRLWVRSIRRERFVKKGRDNTPHLQCQIP